MNTLLITCAIIFARHQTRQTRNLRYLLGEAHKWYYPGEEQWLKLEKILYAWCTHILEGLSAGWQHNISPGLLTRKYKPKMTPKPLSKPKRIRGIEYLVTVIETWRGPGGTPYNGLKGGSARKGYPFISKGRDFNNWRSIVKGVVP